MTPPDTSLAAIDQLMDAAEPDRWDGKPDPTFERVRAVVRALLDEREALRLELQTWETWCAEMTAKLAKGRP